tara:strand:+ start:148 stop:1098 length:951 start_codon:yes stop_codon:yes gene_type:complete
MKNQCIYCKSNNLSFVDNYKFEIDDDVKFLGNMKIFECNSCQIVFTLPMPELNKLNYFYENIYRKYSRPHFYNKFYKKNSYLYDINLEYISYLTSNINFEKINTLLDFGAGLGNIGYALKKKFKHLQIYSLESDENCQDILRERGYKNYKNLDDINIKFDLIISLHVFEHLTNINLIKQLTNFINVNGYFFFEVPNADFKEGYNSRVFDSPHLIFFNNNNIRNIFDKFDLYKIFLLNTSYDINHDIENQILSKNKSNGKTIYSKIVLYLKKYEPYILQNIRIRLNLFKNLLSEDRLKWYFNGNKKGRCIRGLYKKK